MQAQIGHVVTAVLVGGINGEPRQGVFIKNNDDGTIRIAGKGENYTCEGPEGVVVVPFENLLGAAADHVKTVRRALDLSETY